MTGAGWYYLNTGKKQHLVRDVDMAGFPMQSAVCGCQILAALPAEARWHSDADGLAERDKCKQCVAVLEGKSHVRGR